AGVHPGEDAARRRRRENRLVVQRQRVLGQREGDELVEIGDVELQALGLAWRDAERRSSDAVAGADGQRQLALGAAELLDEDEYAVALGLGAEAVGEDNGRVGGGRAEGSELGDFV